MTAKVRSARHDYINNLYPKPIIGRLWFIPILRKKQTKKLEKISN